MNIFQVLKWNWLNAMLIIKVNHLVIENNEAKLKSNFYKAFTHSTHFEKSFAKKNNLNIHVGLYFSRYSWSLDTYEKKQSKTLVNLSSFTTFNVWYLSLIMAIIYCKSLLLVDCGCPSLVLNSKSLFSGPF